MVRNLWNTCLLIGHGHTEGLSKKHGYIVFSLKKLIIFAIQKKNMNNMKMNKTANFSVVPNTHTVSFYLILTSGLVSIK